MLKNGAELNQTLYEWIAAESHEYSKTELGSGESATPENLYSNGLPATSLPPSVMRNIGFHVDSLTAVMLLIITGIGFLIHVYSIGYMHGDAGYTYFCHTINALLRLSQPLCVCDVDSRVGGQLSDDVRRLSGRGSGCVPIC